MNAGSLGVRLLALLLDLAADDELADVVFLSEVEKLADVVGALGTQTTRACGVCTR